VEYGSLIKRLEEQDAEAEQMEDKLTHMAREVDSSRLNAGEYGTYGLNQKARIKRTVQYRNGTDRSAAGHF